MWLKTYQNSTSSRPCHHFFHFFFHKHIQLSAQKHAKTRPPKLPSQRPMPTVVQHVFFAKLYNYVLKNIPKLDLQNWSASPPCQHSTRLSRKDNQLRDKKMPKFDLQNLPATSPCQHFFNYFQHLFLAEILNYVLKSMPKLDLQNWPTSSPGQHFLNISLSQI